ncbi:MAG: DUF1223 domain-containing protein [Acidobacteria bacterium]|nr:DUF1223 domain-containing protein [Acidobacteriota bacterium]
MLRPKVQLSVLGIAAPALVLAAVVAWAAGAARGRGAAPEPSTAGGHGPVVVELFTSQGCSSCPPADRLLSRLKHDPKLAGNVIPLAFHVDYWNHLGWSDPFSSARWSQRQTDYAHAFRSNRIYTPQLVVNGRTECVGSEESQVMRRIRDALAAEPAGVVSLGTPVTAAAAGDASAGTAAAGAGGGAKVTVTARLLRSVAGPGPDVWVALTESGLTTAVGAGENASATLRNDQVVRLLIKALTLPATATSAAGPGAPGAASAAGAAGERSAEVTLPIDGTWNRGALDVVAFLQDPRSLSIYGATSRPLAPR